MRAEGTRGGSPTFVVCPSCKRFVLSLVPRTWQHHGAIPMCVYFDRQAIEKLQTDMERVKADIDRALRESEKYQSKAP